jgi:large subunit ribosomal protein L3
MSVTGILGKKIGMTQVFDERGDVHPITVLQAGPCVITQLKTLAKDGYEPRRSARRVRQGFEGQQGDDRPLRQVDAPPVKMIGSGARSCEPPKGEQLTAKAGDRVLVDIFNDEQVCRCDRHLQGPRFCGRVRRHGFGGGPKSHGHMFQVQGSIGASSFPSRVFPGQRMPGHMGTRRSRCATCAFAASILKRTCSWSRAQYPVRVMAMC